VIGPLEIIKPQADAWNDRWACELLRRRGL